MKLFERIEIPLFGTISVHQFGLLNTALQQKPYLQTYTWSPASPDVMSLQTKSTIYYIIIQLVCERNILSTHHEI